MLFRLTGKTNHGKNRVREHGNTWDHLKTEDKVFFSDQKGPWILVQSQKRSSYVQWVHQDSDEDFKIEEVVDG